ncbi:MAG TPA: Uma2 family endonuclease [Polyangiaceae bacterium]|nr:Uma2 family endonuclease [Polyangiaceae bacterium]
MSARAPRLATAEDLVRFPDDARREIVRGAIVEKAAPSAEHADAQSALALLIKGPFQRKPGGPGGPGGWWILTDVDVEFAPNEVYRPDVAGWRRERMPEPPKGRVLRTRPDWVCEILSPSTASRDLVQKMQPFRQCELPHYWVVDPEHEMLTVHRWTRDGDVVALTASRAERAVRAEPFEGVELDVGRLFGDDPE